MFSSKQSLLKNYQHSQRIIHLFEALDGISKADHIIEKPIKKYLENFLHIKYDAEFTVESCMEEAEKLNVEKILLNMIDQRIEHSIISRPQRVYDIIQTIDKNYSEISA